MTLMDHPGPDGFDPDDWSAEHPEQPGRYKFFHPFSNTVRLYDVHRQGGALFTRRVGEESWRPIHRHHGLWSGPLDADGEDVSA